MGTNLGLLPVPQHLPYLGIARGMRNLKPAAHLRFPREMSLNLYDPGASLLYFGGVGILAVS